MTLLDFVVAIILTYNLFKGVQKGFLTLFIDFISIFVSFLVASTFYTSCGFLIKEATEMTKFHAHVLSFILLFVFSFIFLVCMNKLLNKVLTFSGLGFLNRIAGFLLGGFKGIIYILLILTPFFLFDMHVIHSSKLISPHQKFVLHMMENYLPEQLLALKKNQNK